MVNNVVIGQPGTDEAAVRLAGASGVKLVNNTIVGGTRPVVISSDPRGGTYGPARRPCVEHTQRYGGAGGFPEDCPPGMSSDLDTARPGAYGRTNMTPSLTWRPSIDMLVNNIFAPLGGTGGLPEGPDASSTGVPAGTALKQLVTGAIPYRADTIEGPRLVIRTPGAVYDGWEFNHLVEVRAPGVTFRNSLFRGVDSVVPSAALLYVRNDRGGAGGVPSAVVEDSTFIPRKPNNQIDGVRGSNLDLTRVEITGTVDGVHIHGNTDRDDPFAGNVRITDSWIHDLVFYTESSHPDGTHNDGVQIVGGRNITIVGTRIDGKIRNAAVMVGESRNRIGDLRIVGNWLGSGACTVNIYEDGQPMRGIAITDNTFLTGTQSVKGCATTISPATKAVTVVEGNSWLDADQADQDVASDVVAPGLTIKNYSGSPKSPSVLVPLSELVPSTAVIDGNLYQGTSGAVQIVAPGADAALARTPEEIRAALRAPGVGGEEHGRTGGSWVDRQGAPSSALEGLHPQAAAVPIDPVVNEFVPAGDRHYGARAG